MEKRNILIALHIAVPGLIMFILAYISDTTSDNLFAKGLLLTSILLYYPILFVLQGSVAALLKTNIFLSLGISIAVFIIILIIWLNSSAIIYIFAYLIIFLIGYSLTHSIRKIARSK